MRQACESIVVRTSGRGLFDITRQLRRVVEGSGIEQGLLTVFCRHTSASLTIQENTDPDVRADLDDALDRLAPRDAAWRHGIEGPDDMPAHVRTVLTQSSLGVPVIGGALALGTWQAVYLWEHRDTPHQREVLAQVMGD